MENQLKMADEFNTQMQNMLDAFDNQRQEMNDAFESKSADMSRTYETVAYKNPQPRQSTQSGVPTFFVVFMLLMASAVIVTIIIRINVKRKQAQAREEYKKYEEELYRAQKDNADIPDKETVKAQTADEFKEGISELLNSGKE